MKFVVAAIGYVLMLDRTDANCRLVGHVLVNDVESGCSANQESAIALGNWGSTRSSRIFANPMLLQTAGRAAIPNRGEPLAPNAEGIDALLNAIAAGKAHRASARNSDRPIDRSDSRSREQTQRVEGLLREVTLGGRADNQPMLAKHLCLNAWIRSARRPSESGHKCLPKHCCRLSTNLNTGGASSVRSLTVSGIVAWIDYFDNHRPHRNVECRLPHDE